MLRSAPPLHHCQCKITQDEQTEAFGRHHLVSVLFHAMRESDPLAAPLGWAIMPTAATSSATVYTSGRFRECDVVPVGVLDPELSHTVVRDLRAPSEVGSFPKFLHSGIASSTWPLYNIRPFP